MKRLPVICAFAMALLPGCVDGAKAPAQAATSHFADAAPSVEVLIERLLEAVAANDATALQALRVTEIEYRSIIVPGTVNEGEPRRVISPEATTFFWRMLDTKSRDFSRGLLSEFGGKKLSRTALTYTKGVQRYGGYTAYGQVRVRVVDEQANEGVLRSGTIAEVAGQYKFIGLNWND